MSSIGHGRGAAPSGISCDMNAQRTSGSGAFGSTSTACLKASELAWKPAFSAAAAMPYICATQAGCRNAHENVAIACRAPSSSSSFVNRLSSCRDSLTRLDHHLIRDLDAFDTQRIFAWSFSPQIHNTDLHVRTSFLLVSCSLCQVYWTQLCHVTRLVAIQWQPRLWNAKSVRE